VTLERLPDGLFLERVQVFTADLAKRSVRLRFLFGGDVADGPAEVALAFDKGEESKLTLDVRDGAAEALLTVPGGQVWSPASPHLHTLTAACRSDAVVEQNRRMIRSGINNPCVIFWSFLNEAANDEPGAVPLYETAVAEIRREDPSRLVFVGNASNTGGIAGDSGSVSYKFVNCLMAENNSRTTTGGGGLLRGSSVFVNFTIVSNRHASTSLGMVQGTCTNVLFHGNTRYDLSSATAVNCLYAKPYGTVTATGCIVTNDPCLVYADNPAHPFTPGKKSAARDAGIEPGSDTFAADDRLLAGRGRRYHTIDIGCYEFWPSHVSTWFMVR